MSEIPDSGRSIFVALSEERLFFLYNITRIYQDGQVQKKNLSPSEAQFLERLVEHLKLSCLIVLSGHEK